MKVENEKSRKVKPDYFVTPHITWWILIPYGMYLVIMAGFAPTSVPRYLPLNNLTTYLGTNFGGAMKVIAASAVMAHIIEALLAYRKAKKLGIQSPANIMWGLQVLILGYFAFQHLRT
ncbi:uncharacterized protein LOC136029873 [Artemia franciscana]|uniref:uncharacterized protein LOC136029873 n=1 Tax=Artemia franciscana TaxID=6661 RepID=UPI0032DA4E15